MGTQQRGTRASGPEPAATGEADAADRPSDGGRSTPDAARLHDGRSSPRRGLSLLVLALLAACAAVVIRPAMVGRADDPPVSMTILFEAVAAGETQGILVEVRDAGGQRAGVAVSVSVVDAQGATIGQSAGVTNEDGGFIALIQIPATARPGTYQVVASATIDGAPVAADPRPFAVTGPQPSSEVIRLLLRGFELLEQDDTQGALTAFTEALTAARRAGDRVVRDAACTASAGSTSAATSTCGRWSSSGRLSPWPGR